MKNLILTFASLCVVCSSYAAQSETYLSCYSGGSRDGSGLMQPISLTVVNTDQVVKVKIVTFKESLISRSIVKKSEDLAHQVHFASLGRSEFIKMIQNSGNATLDSQGTLELTFDKSECKVSESDSKLISCYKKDFSGTYFTTSVVTKQIASQDEKSASFTKLEASVSLGAFTNTSLQMPFSYSVSACK